MNNSTKKQAKESTVTMIKGLGKCGKGVMKYTIGAVSGAAIGGVAGGCTGVATGLVVTMATAGMDLGITPAAVGVSFAAAGAGIGAKIGIEIVKPSAAKDMEKGKSKCKNGLKELKSIAKDTQTYQCIKDKITFFSNGIKNNQYLEEEKTETEIIMP